MDSKWIVVARRAGVTPGEVSAVFWRCSITPASRRIGVVLPDLAEIYGPAHPGGMNRFVSILSAMRAKGVITDDDLLAAWEKRQPNREDSSAERVRRHRERKSAESVTWIDRAVVTQRNAPVTQCNAPEKIREDQDREPVLICPSGVAGADRKVPALTRRAPLAPQFLCNSEKSRMHYAPRAPTGRRSARLVHRLFRRFGRRRISRVSARWQSWSAARLAG